MTPFFQLDPKIESASAAALQQVAPRFTEIDEVTEYNQLKVLRAFYGQRHQRTALWQQHRLRLWR